MGFVLQWADPLGSSVNDYDLFLIDADGHVIDYSVEFQNGTQDPIEYITSRRYNDGGHGLVIVKFSGAERYLRLDTIQGHLAVATPGNTVGHSASASAIGVAQVDVRTPGGGSVFDGTETVRTTSSDGPRRIFFQSAAPITPGDLSATGGRVLQKPDLAAASCVVTATPGFDVFCGTSAAAPHAAAIAALMLDAAGGPANVSLAELRTVMMETALDIEAPGTDRDAGAGIVMALDAVAAVAVGSTARNGTSVEGDRLAGP